MSQAPLELPLGLEARLMVLFPRVAFLVRPVMAAEVEDTGEALLLGREAEEVRLYCAWTNLADSSPFRRWRWD